MAPGLAGGRPGPQRVSTEDWQDPVTSRARQLQQAVMLVAGRGAIVAEFFDAGESRTLPWARRPRAAAPVAALADPDPDRGWDAIVIGEYERAFYGSQYALMAPLFEHYGVSLWIPEVGGRVDWHAEDHEQTMLALGLSSKREITRTSIRVRTAMAAQTREQGPLSRRAPALRVPASFRQARLLAFWRLGFRQSGFRHIARISRHAVPYASATAAGFLACYCPRSFLSDQGTAIRSKDTSSSPCPLCGLYSSAPRGAHRTTGYVPGGAPLGRLARVR